MSLIFDNFINTSAAVVPHGRRFVITPQVPALWPNVPIHDGRRDLGGETVCPARERDGSRCGNDSGMWSYAHLCPRHSAILRRGVKLVLVNGTRLDGPAWTRATRLGLYVAAEKS